MNTVQIYRGHGVRQRWRWRVVSSNGQIVAQGEAYATKWNAKRSARKLYPGLAIREVPGGD